MTKSSGTKTESMAKASDPLAVNGALYYYHPKSKMHGEWFFWSWYAVLAPTYRNVLHMPISPLWFVRAQNTVWSPKNANIINQILFLQEIQAFSSESFFNAETEHFTETAKYVDPTTYADAMSRSEANLWQEAFDKEIEGLVARNVFTVVDRPVNRNRLGTTMIYKYKIDCVNYSDPTDPQVSSLSAWRMAKGRV